MRARCLTGRFPGLGVGSEGLGTPRTWVFRGDAAPFPRPPYFLLLGLRVGFLAQHSCSLWPRFLQKGQT